jgi:polar amino acid transport system substrate-binding protein
MTSIAEDLAPTGTLRASINLGNPVLAQGTPSAPSGVTVDLAREIGARLGLAVDLVCFDAARKSYEAMAGGNADLCFLAIEPAREEAVAFTEPYVLIEGVYVVAVGSSLTEPVAVDAEGVRIGVNRGSAYDLFLTRTLQHAELVRGNDGIDEFRAKNLEATAGVRQPMAEFVAANPGFRMLDGRFMEIRQAVGTTRTRAPETVDFLRRTVEELKASGFVAQALERSGQASAAVAP